MASVDNGRFHQCRVWRASLLAMGDGLMYPIPGVSYGDILQQDDGTRMVTKLHQKLGSDCAMRTALA